MPELLLQKMLGIPLIVWALQLLYVAVALVIFMLLLARIDTSTSTRLLVQIAYVAVILIIDIIWRLVIKQRFPHWF